eukprot:344660-Lingulodinium_polyedra.AAC.1
MLERSSKFGTGTTGGRSTSSGTTTRQNSMNELLFAPPCPQILLSISPADGRTSRVRYFSLSWRDHMTSTP